MFTHLTLETFKNFRDATLELGPFTVLVGANASGKSNLRDAFRFLHGIGRGYDFGEILEGAYGDGGEKVWSGIRGGVKGITFKNTRSFHLAYTLAHPPAQKVYKFAIGVQVRDPTSAELDPYTKPRLLTEVSGGISGDGQSLDYQAPPEGIGLDGKETISVRLPAQEKIIEAKRDRPVAAQLLDGLRKAGTDTIYLGGETTYAAQHTRRAMRFVDLDLKALRQSSNERLTKLGDRGQNLASVLKEICQDEQTKKLLVEWVETLTPMDAKDFEFDVAKHSDEVTLILVEKDGTKTPMQSVSGGTLRFLGLLALLFQDDPPRLLFIEEIETGLHPTRLDLLANLIEQRTEQTETQVIATTHSPHLLQVLSQNTLEDVQLVYRTGDGPEAKICPLLEVPSALEVLGKPRQNVAELHQSGWFENAMAFSGGETVSS